MFFVILRVSTLILKQLSFSNTLGDNIVTVTDNVLTHIFEDFRSYEFFPLLHNHNNVLTVRKQNWLDVKERRHAAIHYHRKRNIKNRFHRSRTWKRHHHHWLMNTVPNFKTLLYYTGELFEHTRVTDQSSYDTTSD